MTSIKAPATSAPAQKARTSPRYAWSRRATNPPPKVITHVAPEIHSAVIKATHDTYLLRGEQAPHRFLPLKARASQDTNKWLTTKKCCFRLVAASMNQPQQRSLWRRWIALSGLLSLLFLSVVSAAHVHSADVSSGVRQECKLCATGRVSPIPTSGIPLLAALAPAFFLSAALEVRPCSVRRHQPGDPRSPPSLS